MNMQNPSETNHSKPPSDSLQDTSIYEDPLVDKFLDYLKNDKLLKLGIPKIFSILSKYTNTHGKQENQDEIFDFFIKCLNEYGRRASPLLEFIDFSTDDKIDYMNKLATEYSNIIDFKYLNSSFIPLLKQSQEKNTEIKNEVEQLKKLFLDKIEETEKKYEKSIEDMKKEIEELKMKNEDQNDFFEIGNVILTSKKLSENKGWLECNGQKISKSKYPQLFNVLQTQPVYEWNEQELDYTEESGYLYYCSDGNYIVRANIKKEENVLYIYSQRKSTDKWKTVIKRLPNGRCNLAWYINKMRYINNEFVIPLLIKEDNYLSLYSIHSQDPEEDWKINKNCAIDVSNINPDIFEDQEKYSYIFEFSQIDYINNTYVVSIFIQDSDNCHQYLAYGLNLSSEFNLNTNFSHKNFHNFPFLEYFNNKWVLCTSCNYDACIYVSNDISSLSPNSEQHIICDGNKSDRFILVGIQTNNKELVVIGYQEKNDEVKYIRIYYSTNLTGFSHRQFDEFTIIDFYSLCFCCGRFFFICHKSEQYFIFYSNENNLDEWENHQITRDHDECHSNFYRIKNILFYICQGETKMHCLNSAINDLYKPLPEYPQIKNLTSYIKANK